MNKRVAVSGVRRGFGRDVGRVSDGTGTWHQRRPERRSALRPANPAVCRRLESASVGKQGFVPNFRPNNGGAYHVHSGAGCTCTMVTILHEPYWPFGTAL